MCRKPKSPVSNKKLRGAVIGLGNQALSDHIPAILRNDQVQLVAVAELIESRLENFAKQYPSIKGYTNYQELLSAEQLDFAVVSLPHILHYQITRDCIDHGVNVLKEKPGAVSLAEAIDLADRSHAAGTKVMISVQRRFNPIHRAFKDLLSKIGRIYYIDGRYSIYTAEPHVGWRGQRRLAGGGCLFDMGYHMIDLLIWYFGLPSTVFAEMSATAIDDAVYDAEDTARVMFQYRDRCLWGTMLISRVIPPKQEFLEVIGTQGILRLNRSSVTRLSAMGQVQEEFTGDVKAAHVLDAQLSHFLDVIRGKAENAASIAQHCEHMALVETAYKAKLAGQYVNIKMPLHGEREQFIQEFVREEAPSSKSSPLIHTAST